MFEPVNDQLKTCAICKNSNGKYVCPRCNIVYCSVPCYRANEHLGCSESFYKECIKEELKLRDGDSLSQKETLKMLQRVEKEEDDDSLDSDDEELEPDITERLADIDLDDADAIWENLTLIEKKEFVELLQKGDVSQIVPPWEPWWNHREEKKLVEEINDSNIKKHTFMDNCPKPLERIPLLDQICKTPPSTCIKYNLMNILYAYAYMAQYFAGDHHNFAMEAVNIIIIICNNIRNGSNYDSAEIAIESAVSEANNCQWLSSSEEIHKTIKKDVQHIIEGPNESNRSFYILSALSDLHRLMEKSKSETGKETKVKGTFAKKFCDGSLFSFPPVSKQKLRSYLKKIEYYLSWSQMYAAEMIPVE